MEKKDNSHQKWAQGRKASMKRRCEEQDYLDRGIYMITMAIEGRRQLLGTLTGNPAISEGDEAPHVVLSPLGERVRQCWLDIHRYYHQIEPMKLCIMPDHIHGILFVHERIERHLGHVIWGFKTGTRKAARELGLLPAAQCAQPTQQSTGQEEPCFPSPSPQSASSQSVQYAAHLAQPQPQPPSRHTAAGRAHGTLWEPGYNDRLLLHKDQLQRMLAYLDDNPRRLLLKRHHPEYFTHLGTITVAGTGMEAMGNAALLTASCKLQVQCSRHLYQSEIEERKQHFLEAGRHGAVIVSPCISPGESQIATACMAAGIPLIVLLLKGFPTYFKPEGRYLKACAEGRLLLLSPYRWQNDKITDMRQRCLHLNELARLICEETTSPKE